MTRLGVLRDLSMVKRPPIGGSKGHLEEAGSGCFSCLVEKSNPRQLFFGAKAYKINLEVHPS